MSNWSLFLKIFNSSIYSETAFFCCWLYQTDEPAHLTDLLAFRTFRADWASLTLKKKTWLVRWILPLYNKGTQSHSHWEQQKGFLVLVDSRLKVSGLHKKWQWSWLLIGPSHSQYKHYMIFKRYEIFLRVPIFISRISSCSTEELCTRLGWIKITTLFSKVAFKTISTIKTELNKDKTPGKIAITSIDIPPSGSFCEVLTTTRSPSTSQTWFFL